MDSRYDFATEVYFVGRLFKKLIDENDIAHFQYTAALGRMCQHDPSQRTQSFADIQKEVRNDQFVEFDFTDFELKAYRDFADQICAYISKIENGVIYATDTSGIVRELENAYRSFMLESDVPSPTVVIRCFVLGTYYYNRHSKLSVGCVRDFVRMLKSATEEKRRLILANLNTRLDALPHYAEGPPTGENIPF